MPEIKVAEVIRQLEQFKETHGEEEYQKAARGLAVQLVRNEAGCKVVRDNFPFLDIEELKKEAAERGQKRTQVPSDQAMAAALQERIPSLKTQAQYNLFTTIFETLTTYLDYAFQGDKEGATRLKDGLDKLLASAFTITEIGERLQDEPEAAKSPEAAEFREPPREFQEVDIQRKLATELMTKTSLAELNQWYEETVGERDRIVSQSLRNELFDAIRDRKKTLQEAAS